MKKLFLFVRTRVCALQIDPGNSKHAQPLNNKTNWNSLLKFFRRLGEIDKKQDDDYKREIDAIYKQLSAKNQEKLADLLANQQEEEDELADRAKHLPKEVRY